MRFSIAAPVGADAVSVCVLWGSFRARQDGRWRAGHPLLGAVEGQCAAGPFSWGQSPAAVLSKGRSWGDPGERDPSEPRSRANVFSIIGNANKKKTRRA